MTGRSFTLGVVRTGTVLDEVVLEILEHQGILYEEIQGGEAGEKYPAILMATSSADAFATAQRNCASSDSVVVAESHIDLGQILRCLAGQEDSRVDRLNLAVNEFEFKLMALIAKAFSATNTSLVRKCFWPGNARACCVITGDVDWLKYSPFHAAVVRGGRSPGRLASLLLGYLAGKNFGMNFDEMVETQKQHNFRSTVFLRAAYDGGEENLVSAVNLLKHADFEIGLHGSEGAHTSLDSLNSQLETIAARTGQRPSGVRHHILKMSIPKTWEIESSAGLAYDATFSYNRFFGFRGEVCYPYHPFTTHRIPLLELPTSFMDWTALNRNLRGKKAEEVINQIMQKVEHYHGLLMVNFHNTYLNRQTFPDILALYKRLVSTVSERGYWVTTAQSCSEWWMRRAATRPDVTLGGGVKSSCGEILLEVLTEKDVSTLGRRIDQG